MKISFVVVGFPNNSILPSLSMICAYPLLQVSPATHYRAAAAAPNHTIQSRWQISTFRTAPPFATISFLFFLAHTPSRNPLPTVPTSIRAHCASTSPHGMAGCPSPCSSPCTHNSCTTCAARRSPPTWVGAPVRPLHTRILRRPQYTQHHPDPPPFSLSTPIPAAPPPGHRDNPISKHNQRRRHLRRRALAPQMGGRRTPDGRPYSSTITRARQRGMTLGSDDYGARKPCRRSAAIEFEWCA
jgi:hypothetical protein